ncbi:unnamed protein product [Sympodiomycopsis kandeliae]
MLGNFNSTCESSQAFNDPLHESKRTLDHSCNMASLSASVKVCIAGPSRLPMSCGGAAKRSLRQVHVSEGRANLRFRRSLTTSTRCGDAATVCESGMDMKVDDTKAQAASAATKAASHSPIEPPTLASTKYLNPSARNAQQISSTSSLPAHHKSTLSSLLRVDHSGEIAANTIYQSQSLIFKHIKKDVPSTELMLEMWENEKKHLKIAEMLLKQHNVRPSLLNPVWSSLGSVLGAATAMMGKEAAMACTEAVETVIGEHYDDQITHLDTVLDSFRSGIAQGESQASVATDTKAPMQETLETLNSLLEEFRDDELEHLDTAVEHDAQQAPAHALLSAVIGWGCKGAIEVAKRV